MVTSPSTVRLGLLLVPGLVGCATGALPREAVVYNRRGAEHLAADRLDDAEASFHLAIEYHPRFSEPWANLGVVSLRRGDLPEAERLLRAALELHEDFALAWANLGVVLERRGHAREACDAYARALAIDPGVLEARRNLGLLLLGQGDARRARAHLLRLVQLTPDDAAVLAWLAYAELRLGLAPEADRHVARSLELAPDLPLARLVRGLRRARAGAHDGAVEDLRRAAADPGLRDAAELRLAVVLLARGDREAAADGLAALRRRGVTLRGVDRVEAALAARGHGRPR